MSLNLMFVATFFAFILLVNGNPIDSNEKYDIVVCPEGAQEQNGCKHDTNTFFYRSAILNGIKFMDDTGKFLSL